MDSFKQKVDGLSSAKGDQAGIWQLAMCLRMLATLSAAAPLPKEKKSQRMPHAQRWDLDEVEDSVVKEISA